MDKYAKEIWQYMLLNQKPIVSDAVFVLCSIDERVAEYGAKLFLDGFGKWLIFSGGVAHGDDLLKVAWDSTEADHFAAIAKKMGVPSDKIIIENKATNTGENISFTYTLLEQLKLNLISLLLVQKPYMERRTYATFKKQWPSPNTAISVTSPPITYESYFDKQNDKDTIINIMVGDLQRIKEYPKLGYQIGQRIPDRVWGAYNELVNLGYTKHLI